MDYKALVKTILTFVAIVAFCIGGVYSIQSGNETLRGILSTIFIAIITFYCIRILYLLNKTE